MKGKIFIVTHKALPLINNELYTPIQVGYGDTISNVLRDNTGEQISIKNENFCELTASYWINKNVKDCQYVGICHYRRFFNFYPSLFNFFPSRQKKISSEDFKKTKTFRASAEKTDEKIASILRNYDCIMLRGYDVKEGLSASYYNPQGHRKSDWNTTLDIIKELYPEYTNSIKKYLDEAGKFHMGNMMITTKEKWDNYHEWLFSILFELEKRIEIPTDAVQKRVFGYISERIINLYVYHNNFKIKEFGGYKITDI
ncbi:DUF4422 domain-containing protein [Flavobacterium sp.]|uniref:DUF4422 domain-containing protein n=1 Tax=Flavobacterium sp. TaxID=239 RepID=UPI002FDCE001